MRRVNQNYKVLFIVKPGKSLVQANYEGKAWRRNEGWTKQKFYMELF